MHRQRVAPEPACRTDLLDIEQVAATVAKMHFSRLIEQLRHLRQRQRIFRFY
ncbi:hypothetical protein FIV07_12105 [Mycobacterium sp. THAF192]|nr:hypothetical protein FIV07_12105 [Mycobacterium sp. THAF192]